MAKGWLGGACFSLATCEHVKQAPSGHALINVKINLTLIGSPRPRDLNLLTFSQGSGYWFHLAKMTCHLKFAGEVRCWF